MGCRWSSGLEEVWAVVGREQEVVCERRASCVEMERECSAGSGRGNRGRIGSRALVWRRRARKRFGRGEWKSVVEEGIEPKVSFCRRFKDFEEQRSRPVLRTNRGKRSIRRRFQRDFGRIPGSNGQEVCTLDFGFFSFS
ncbi:hypothetical protein MA16_Dca028815 [Dendrobium catenatum]|uniref:Uncharacterized protein n=1 Tax=Dendrobium catenatum TaxID=906689 RepID=A0A2I0VHK9_9ASPA|nr:hypothetical protein MA16_Dca028815 [Dendrobium catenatum]